MIDGCTNGDPAPILMGELMLAEIWYISNIHGQADVGLEWKYIAKNTILYIHGDVNETIYYLLSTWNWNKTAFI